MGNLRLAAAFLALYAVLLLASGLYYLSWSGDRSELLQVVLRILAAAVVAWGLLRADRWAWIVGVIFSALFGVAGLFGVVGILGTGQLQLRPHPAVDLAFLVTCALSLLAACVAMVMPSAQRAVRDRTEADTSS